MTIDDFVDAFDPDELRSDDFHFTDLPIALRLSTRKDLCAFLILDQLLPGKTGKIVSCAEHDQVWLDIDCEALSKVIDVPTIYALRACGMFYDASNEALSMWA